MTFSISEFVLYLNSHKVPQAEIDRIVLILLQHPRSAPRGSLRAKIGATHVKVVHDFFKMRSAVETSHKRIRELVASTIDGMEGEDNGVKRARLEAVMLAVHTLGSMSMASH